MSHFLLQIDILWPGPCAGLLVLLTHVPLGQEVLRRGIIFLDLAIAQTAAFGVVVAGSVWSLHHEMTTFVAIIAASIGAGLLYSIRNFEVKLQEAMIGILFILMATGSILVLASDPHGGERLKEILVGQILWLTPTDLWQLFASYAALILVWCIRQKTGQDWLFYPIFAVAITLSTQYVGVYLVFASLIIPTVVTQGCKQPLLRAYGLGAIGYLTGLLASALLDLPAGASIVWTLASVSIMYAVIVCFVKSKKITCYKSPKRFAHFMASLKSP